MTAARPDTWMPLYWGDYLRDTGHLSAAEHGAYLLLIGHYWTTGKPLPNDDTLLARIARMAPKAWKQARSIIEPFFQVSGNEWSHKRIAAELAKWERLIEAKSNAGRASALARAQQSGQQNINRCSTYEATNTPTKFNPSPSPSPSPSPEVRTPTIPTGSSPPKPTKGTRLADDWKPDEADRAYALERGIAPDLEAENFRDYWLARSGSGAVKLDWSRTWKRWVRTAAKGRGKGKPGPSGTTAPRKGLASAILDVAADFQRRSEQGHGDRGLYGDGLARGYGEGQDDLGGSLEADGDGRIIDGVCEDVAADAAEAGRGNGTGDGVPRAAMPGTGGRGGVRASEVAGAQPVVPDVARTEGYDRHSGGTTAEDARIAILGGARIAQDKRNDVSGPEPPGNTQTRTTDEITGKQANA